MPIELKKVSNAGVRKPERERDKEGGGEVNWMYRKHRATRNSRYLIPLL